MAARRRRRSSGAARPDPDGAAAETMARALPTSRWLLAVAEGGALLVLVDAVWLRLRAGGVVASTVVAGLAIAATAILAAVLAFRRARVLWEERGPRAGWLLLSASELAYAAGIALTVVQFAIWGGLPLSEMPGDVAYFAAMCLGIAALLALSAPVWSRFRVRLLLDGSIVASSVLILAWITMLRPVYESQRGSTYDFVVTLMYAVAGVAAAVIVLSSIAHTRPLDPSLLLVALGILILTLTASAYAVVHYSRPGMLDAGFPAGNLVLALAGLAGRPPTSVRRESNPSHWQVLLPYLPVLATTPAVLVQVRLHGRLDTFSQVLSGCSIALVLGRQLTAVLEAQSLSRRLSVTLQEQRVVVDQAPVGICRLDGDGRLRSVNRRLAAMLGWSAEELEGRPMTELIHPDDLNAGLAALAGLVQGLVSEVTMESRGLRSDGTTIWCASRASPLRGVDGRVDRIVAVIEDVTERKRSLLRAARIQRDLLPQTTPVLDGYELAGACVPAEEVAGDFYDWVLNPDGSLDLTLADVMGKGVPSALVMAVLRTALRLAPASLGPEERVRAAAGSMMLGGDDGLFVTLFHARVDLATGIVRYVDAGHGYCGVLRASGRLDRLTGRSLPLGVSDAEPPRGETVHLEPGDSLVVHSDGLVETGEDVLALSELTPALKGSSDAEEMVRRLLAETAARPADDVTVVVLWRRPDGPREEALPGVSGRRSVASR